MVIHGPHNQSQFKMHAYGAASPAGKGPAGRGIARNPGSEGPGAEHVQAPEVLQLVGRMRQLADSREDHLSEVANRLAQGEYLTRAAAERTAATIAENSFG